MMLILLQFFSQPAPQPKPKKDEKKKRKRPKKGKPLKKLTKGISACSFSQLKTDKEIYVLINNMCKVNQITLFFFSLQRVAPRVKKRRFVLGFCSIITSGMFSCYYSKPG